MSNPTSTPSPERDQQILAIGRQCSHPSCLLVDFLPFKCQHCADSFCADHFKPESHSCSKYDETKYNRVAPDCGFFLPFAASAWLITVSLGPLCNEPVPIPPGEDPNIRMERHLSVDCSVMTGRSRKASSAPKCARPKCGKVLFVQIQCDVSLHYLCFTFISSLLCRNVARSSVPSIAFQIPTTALPSRL